MQKTNQNILPTNHSQKSVTSALHSFDDGLLTLGDWIEERYSSELTRDYFSAIKALAEISIKTLEIQLSYLPGNVKDSLISIGTGLQVLEQNFNRSNHEALVSFARYLRRLLHEASRVLGSTEVGLREEDFPVWPEHFQPGGDPVDAVLSQFETRVAEITGRAA